MLLSSSASLTTFSTEGGNRYTVPLTMLSVMRALMGLSAAVEVRRAATEVLPII